MLSYSSFLCCLSATKILQLQKLSRSKLPGGERESLAENSHLLQWVLKTQIMCRIPL